MSVYTTAGRFFIPDAPSTRTSFYTVTPTPSTWFSTATFLLLSVISAVPTRGISSLIVGRYVFIRAAVKSRDACTTSITVPWTPSIHRPSVFREVTLANEDKSRTASLVRSARKLLSTTWKVLQITAILYTVCVIRTRWFPPWRKGTTSLLQPPSINPLCELPRTTRTEIRA